MPRGRRAGQEGSVRRLSSGRWQARFPASLDPYQRPIPNGPFASEVRARAALEEAIERVRAGLMILENRPSENQHRTVADAVEALVTENTNLAPH